MISRRGLLQSAAATALLAPFYKEAWGQSATPPKRLVIVLEGNGIYPEAFLTSRARSTLGATAIGTRHNFLDAYPQSSMTLQGDALSSGLCLGPLAGSSGAISLENRAAVVLGLSSTITGGGHSSGTGALSCAINGAAATIDVTLASRLKGNAPFEALRLGTSSSPTPIVYQTCNHGPGKPAGVLVDPSKAYDATFGTLANGATTGQERGMLLDFARNDVNIALSTFTGNSTERAKLEQYLGSLDSLRAREAQLRTMGPQVLPLLPPAPANNPLLQNSSSPPDSLLWLAAQFQIATAALLGGLTNNVVLASGCSGFDVHYPSIIASIGRHDLQHGIAAPAYWTAIAAVTRQHVQLVANLARTLAATPEVGASGSMLDHTIIVFMSDNGEQHHSEAREWPTLVLGGNALGLKTDGRTVIFPAEGQSNNRQVSNLFNTLGHAFGDSTFDTFGNEGPRRITPGPLSELLA